MQLDAHLAFRHLAGKRIHLGLTGSIAAYKVLDLARELIRAGADVGATLTESGSRFVTPLSLAALGVDPVQTIFFEEPGNDLYGHLFPAQSAHAMAVIPASADTLARLAHGRADDLLACQVLAFEGPLLLAPAMNTRMWRAQATQSNWSTLLDRGAVGVSPSAGLLACGEEGDGRLPDARRLFLHCVRMLSERSMAGKRVLVTMGPTREFFDPARFWSNPSSGTMGAALAVACWLRGAEVTVVSGPSTCWLPPEIARQDVVSAREMHEAALDKWSAVDVAFAVAAVADYRPESHGSKKFKKETATSFTPAFERNPDILADMGKRKKKDQLLIGFAAETDELEANAQAKLMNKRLDAICANPIGLKDSGFSAPTNEIVVLRSGLPSVRIPKTSKTACALAILDTLFPEPIRADA